MSGDDYQPPPPPHPVRAESRPCAVCSREIVGGQLFIPRGPWHVYCQPPRKLDVARVAQAARTR